MIDKFMRRLIAHPWAFPVVMVYTVTTLVCGCIIPFEYASLGPLQTLYTVLFVYGWATLGNLFGWLLVKILNKWG